MKKFFLCFILFFSFGCLSAQDLKDTISLRHSNNAFVTFGGANGALISFNYEKLLKLSHHSFLAINLGIGFNREFELCIFGPCVTRHLKNYLIVPHQLTYNIGKKSYYFEIGVGGAIIGGISSPNYLIYPLIGLRIQPTLTSKKIAFRLSGGFPFQSYQNLDFLFIPVGYSLGKSF